MTTIAITGITGKSGRFLLARMNERRAALSGCRFIASVRAASDTAFLDDAQVNIEKAVCDVRNFDQTVRFLDGAQTVLHIAGIGKSVNVVKACLACGVRWVILVHTTGIYSKHKAAVGSYREVEARVAELTRGRDITVTILRPTMIYGTLDDRNLSVFIRLVDRLKIVPVVAGGRAPLQPVWAKDLGGAYLDVLLHPAETMGREFILSGEKPVTLIALLRLIQEKLGVRRLYVSVPFWLAYGGARLLYLLSRKKKRFDYREKVQRLAEPRAYPHDAATAAFGYRPTPLSEGIADEIASFLLKKST